MIGVCSRFPAPGGMRAYTRPHLVGASVCLLGRNTVACPGLVALKQMLASPYAAPFSARAKLLALSQTGSAVVI